MAKVKVKQIEATSNLDMQTGVTKYNIVNLADPVAPQDAATKSYVDAKLQGLDPKASVKAATTAALTYPFSGPMTIDTVSVIAGDRVLVKNQTGATEKYNGIWDVQAGIWTRANDTDTWAKLVSAFTFVEEGYTNKDTGWVCTIDAGGTLGADPIAFTQFSGAGSYTADESGIHLNGTVFELSLGNDSVSKTGGLKAAVQYQEEGLSAATSSPTVKHYTGLTISNTPAGDCDIVITVNGVKETISYGSTTGSFYYAAPGTSGVAGRAKANIVAGDELWFNPVTAQYALETTDVLTQIYSKIN